MAIIIVLYFQVVLVFALARLKALEILLLAIGEVIFQLEGLEQSGTLLVEKLPLLLGPC